MKKFYIIILLILATPANSQDNLLKVVALNYKLKTPNNNFNYKFNRYYPFSNHFLDVTVGNEWADFQPVGIFQNVSDETLTFKVRCVLKNDDLGKLIYNRYVTVSDECLKASQTDSVLCNEIPYIKVWYSAVSENNGFYSTVQLPYPGNTNLTGIPPGGFAEVEFPPFSPNNFLPTHIGNATITLNIIPIVPETGDTLSEGDFSDDTLENKFLLRRIGCSELFYPLDGDTVKSGDNYFYSLSDVLSSGVFLEFSKESDFQTIDRSINKVEATNLNFEQNTWYYWRLKVMAQDSNCISATRTFYVMGGTSVSENSTDLYIIPSPATDFIMISSPFFKRDQGVSSPPIHIFNVLGNIVLSVETRYALSLQHIDISALPPGVYFICIGDVMRKFVKIEL